MRKKVRVFFRRCHVCNGITECEGTPVERCAQCGKSIAPFYFFNDLEVPPLSEHGLRSSSELEEPGARIPVRGFTAYW